MLRHGMFFLLLVVQAQCNVSENSGPVQAHCLECICKVESGCKAIGCHKDVGSLSCGYYQIKEGYWIDCGKPGKDWKSCADDYTCASQCVQNYMIRYSKSCPQTCEGFAREHNGGPRGCKNPATLGYWKRLKSIKGCGDLETLRFQTTWCKGKRVFWLDFYKNLYY
ncbi:hypothetical protein FSP39_025231 [Pinctada imbricata]|uniref:lysozyme n=1 Tax=Pinctada imbricata TaxID=66713 RepID=A0AA88YU21_PINIB|nr:hypothetical protein FSP39_025231 [Pinctada imbricata]